MVDVNVLAVIAATIGAFMLSAAYYAALGNQLATVSAAAAAAAGDQPAPWAIAAELARTAVIVAVVAGLASRTGVDDWAGGAVLGSRCGPDSC